MKLVLLRHATRSPYDGGDSSLSTKGRAQSEEFVAHVAPRGALPVPTRLVVSPKKRAKETLTPLSHSTHLPLEIESRLDERHQTETSREFMDRITSVFTDLEARANDGGCVYLCTHLDWLEGAMIVLNHDLSELEASLGWSTAEYKVFRLEDGIWKSKAKGHVT